MKPRLEKYITALFERNDALMSLKIDLDLLVDKLDSSIINSTMMAGIIYYTYHANSVLVDSNKVAVQCGGLEVVRANLLKTEDTDKILELVDYYSFILNYSTSTIPRLGGVEYTNNTITILRSFFRVMPETIWEIAFLEYWARLNILKQTKPESHSLTLMHKAFSYTTSISIQYLVDRYSPKSLGKAALSELDESFISELELMSLISFLADNDCLPYLLFKGLAIHISRADNTGLTDEHIELIEYVASNHSLAFYTAKEKYNYSQVDDKCDYTTFSINAIDMYLKPIVDTKRITDAKKLKG